MLHKITQEGDQRFSGDYLKLLQECLDKEGVLKKEEYAGMNIRELARQAVKEIPDLIKKAKGIVVDKDGNKSYRRRAVQTVHKLLPDNTSTSTENIMISLFLKGTFAGSHKHGGEISSDKDEYFYRLRGELAIVIHNNAGKINNITILNEINPFIHIPPRTWHSVICLTENTGMLEFKDGPYDPKTDKEFHPTLPQELYDQDGYLVSERKKYLENIVKLVQRLQSSGQ